nr:Na(+)/H(+) exchange regulatory cofactor NHE-RF4 [Zootoca vivipara]
MATKHRQQLSSKGPRDTAELTMKFEFNPRDGIDNPALSLAEDSGNNGERHLGLLRGWQRKDQLFPSWYLQRGRLASPSTSGTLPLSWQVVWKIKSSGKQVSLTVLDGTSYELAKALDRDLGQLLPHHNRPQLCCVNKDQSGFGFSVSAPEGVKGTFRLSVPKDGPAHKAGVPDGSWLLELNGACVESWTFAQLHKKIKHSSNPMGLLVIDAKSEEFYRQRGVKVTAAMADASWVPFEVRKLQMVRGQDGYGFLLKEEKRCSGERGQFLREVESGLPAEKAGMRDGDRLLAVNSEGTEDLDHQEVVLRIRADSSRVALLVIDAEGSKFYDLVCSSLSMRESTKEIVVGSYRKVFPFAAEILEPKPRNKFRHDSYFWFGFWQNLGHNFIDYNQGVVA